MEKPVDDLLHYAAKNSKSSVASALVSPHTYLLMQPTSFYRKSKSNLSPHCRRTSDPDPGWETYLLFHWTSSTC
jgi:hypothetical protein